MYSTSTLRHTCCSQTQLTEGSTKQAYVFPFAKLTTKITAWQEGGRAFRAYCGLSPVQTYSAIRRELQSGGTGYPIVPHHGAARRGSGRLQGEAGGDEGGVAAFPHADACQHGCLPTIRYLPHTDGVSFSLVFKFTGICLTISCISPSPSCSLALPVSRVVLYALVDALTEATRHITKSRARLSRWKGPYFALCDQYTLF